MTTDSREVITDDVPADLIDYYRETADRVPDLTRRFWRENSSADPHDLELWLHAERLAEARQRKDVAPDVARFQATMDRARTASQCKACGDWAGPGSVDGLCAACTRIADQEAAQADKGRRDRVLRHLAQLAATGRQWRGHDISNLTD